MTGEVLNYFVCANSAKGFVNHFASNLAGLERLYILKGGPGTGKSTLMSRVGEEFRLRGYTIERIHCSGDSGSLDGVIIQELKVGLVDGTSPHVIEPKAPGAVEEYVNLGVAWDGAALTSRKEDIMAVNKRIGQCYSSVYALLAESAVDYEKLRKFYGSKLSREKQLKIVEDLLADLFQEDVSPANSQVVQRFFGGITAGGMIDYLDQLIKPCTRRYYLKGKKGSGKSQLLEAVVALGLEKGYDLEVYYSPYDPQCLEMVIIRALNSCVFDATVAGKPTRYADRVVNLDEALDYSGMTDDEADYGEQLMASWQRQVDEAITFLAQAKAQHDILEQIYIPTVDFTIVEQIGDVIIEEISMLAEKKV